MAVISVVTVIRNNLRGLQATVASLRDQIGSDFEHIIVDGDSNDGTKEFLENIAVDYPLRWVSEPDKGLYDAMNKGVSLARSPVIFFLNGADTLVSGDVLEEVANSWRASGWQWAFGGINFVDAEGGLVESYTGVPYSRRKVELGRAYVPHPATFMSTEEVRSVGQFRPEFGLSADQELILRVAAKSEPHIFSSSLTNMEIGGAHAASSASETARRYQRIRRSHYRLVLGHAGIDEIYTAAQGWIWSGKQLVRERLLGKPRM